MKDYSHIQARNSGLTARLPLLLFSVDARAALGVLIILFNISWTSFYIFLGILAFFSLLEHLGFGLPVAIRRARAVMAGKKRYVNKVSKRRRRFLHE